MTKLGSSFLLNTTYLGSLCLVFYLALPNCLSATDYLSQNNNFEQTTFDGENYTAILSGMQEVCPKITRGSGTVTARIHGNTLYVSGHFSNLSSDYRASHIHFGVTGKNGPVIFPLTPDLKGGKTNGIYLESKNTFTLTGEQAWDFKNRQFYVNVHSTQYTGGELRGQLLPEAEKYFHVNLLGKGEVPANGSNAQGQIIFEFRNGALTASGSFDDFSSEVAVSIAGGAHIHHGFSGQNGPVIFPINLTLDADKKGGLVKAENNTFQLTHEQKKALVAEGLYVNIHSLNNRGGEIRGQISSIIKGATYQGNLRGSQEVPAVSTSASGRILATYDGYYHLRISGSFTGLSSPATGAHIHLGKQGSNGPVIFPLTPKYSADRKSGVFEVTYNMYELSRSQITALFNNGLYVNIHTANNRGGEIRTQLIPYTLPQCGASFTREGTTEETALYEEQWLTFDQNNSLENSPIESLGLINNSENSLTALAIYPNPVSDELTINYPNSEKETQLKIIHVSGKQVLQSILPSNAYQQTLNVQHLPAGIYMVVIQSAGETPITKRLVKQGNR